MFDRSSTLKHAQVPKLDTMDLPVPGKSGAPKRSPRKKLTEAGPGARGRSYLMPTDPAGS